MCIMAMLRDHVRKRSFGDERGVLSGDLFGPLPLSYLLNRYGVLLMKRATKIPFRKSSALQGDGGY